jgi:hypothetical protein
MRSHFANLPRVLSAAKQNAIGIRILATGYWLLEKEIPVRFHIANKSRYNLYIYFNYLSFNS